MGIHESQFETMIEDVFEEDAKKTDTIIIDLRNIYAEGYDKSYYTLTSSDSLKLGVPFLKDTYNPFSKDKSHQFRIL